MTTDITKIVDVTTEWNFVQTISTISTNTMLHLPCYA